MWTSIPGPTSRVTGSPRYLHHLLAGALDDVENLFAVRGDYVERAPAPVAA